MTDVEIVQGGDLKVGDTEPNLRVKLLDDAGNPENISGFTQTISIRRSDSDSNKVDGGSMTIHNEDLGIVEYDWSSSDTDSAGVFVAEVKSTDGTDTISYPNDKYFHVHVMEDLS
jgi:hypothetical protein